MKKQLLCIFASMVACVTFLGACSQSSDEGAEPEVWSTYNTRKVLRQTDKNDTYEKLPAKISASMMQGEYEGAQLLITSDHTAEYTLKKGVLKDAAGNEFPAGNIAVYHQKYIQVTKNNSGNKDYESGSYIPDMLLPMETAEEYGENVIEAGCNQGVTVEFDSTGVAAGTYTGTFTLEIDGQQTEVPVSVEVWDFGYERRRTFQSSFLIYREQLMAGEYDTSDEKVQTYVDFLLKYKINSYVIKDAGSWTIEEFVEEAERLYDNNNYNSIVIPYDFPRTYLAYEGTKLTSAAQTVVDYILALAEISTEEKRYLDLAYFYPSSYDEADFNGIAADAERFLKKGGEYDKTLQAAADAIDTDERFSSMTPEFRGSLKESILRIPAVFTNVTYMSDWVENFSAAFCPYFSVYDDEATLQRYQDAAAENAYGDMWAYTCMGPTYPYGTFHIDDSTLGMRVSGWMEKAMGITGYLYYAVNMNTQFRLTEEVYTDVYNNPLRYEDVPGDGYLLYPGKYYGSEEPFATVRLVSYRDSMDDYDMLCVYENLLNEYAEKYGVAIDFNDYVGDLYADLFNGAVYYQQDGLLDAARKELVARILALKESGILLKPGSEAEDGKYRSTVYAPADAVVSVAGTAVAGEAAGSGKAFTFSCDAAQTVTVQVAGKSYTLSANGISSLMNTADVTVSEGSMVSVTGNTAAVTLKAQYRDNGETIGSKTKMFQPYVSFRVSGLGSASCVKFSYENTGEMEIEMSIVFVEADGTKTTVKTNYCGVGGSREVRIDLSAQMAEKLKINLAEVTEIRLAFENVLYSPNGTASLMPDRALVCGNMRVESR